MSLLGVTPVATAAACVLPGALSSLAAAFLAWRWRRAALRAGVDADVLRARLARERRHGAFLAGVLDRISERIAVADLDGQVLLVNDAMRAAGAGGLELFELDGETPVEPARLPLSRALAGERVEGEELICRPAGGDAQQRLLCHASALREDDGRLVGAVFTATDVTEMREAEMRLAEANLVLRAVGDATRELREDGDVAQAICQATRFASGASFAVLFQPDDEGHLVSTGAVGYEGELPVRLPLDAAGPLAVVNAYKTGLSIFAPDARDHPNVASDWARDLGVASVMIQPVAHGEQPIAVLAAGWRQRVGSLSQPTAMSIGLLADEAAVALERADLIEQLRELSLRDPLTGLPNRRAWEHELGRELSRAGRYGQPLCVAIVDLDHFKAYNDQLGHAAGDWLLRAASAAWATVLRDTDVVARWGGEEFAVCLPNCSPMEAETVLARIRAHVPDGQTCSIGLAEWDGEETGAALLARADRALYAAKDAGRDRLVCA